MGVRKLDSPPPATYDFQFIQGMIGKINQNFANIQQSSSTSTTTNGIVSGVWYSGASDPPANLGVVGDFYLNTTTDVIFGPKSSDGWGSGITINSPGGGSTTNNSLSGITFTVPGLLAIDAPAAPLLYSGSKPQTFTSIISILEVVPSAGAISYAISVGGAIWASVTTTGEITTTTAPALQVAANSLIELDITGVGNGLFSGSGLTVIIR